LTVARFDVYTHPDAAARKNTPYLLDIQNEYIDSLATRIVIPLRPVALYKNRLRDLNPVFEILGKQVVLDTASMAAFPTRELIKSVANLQDKTEEIVAALDCIFGSY
jgi:toxin CcdB